MKILFQGVCKRVPNCQTYDELVGHIGKRLKVPPSAQIGETLKLFYLDEDGDIICVSCNDDLQEAMLLHPDGRIKMALSANSDEASTALTSAVNALDTSSMMNSSMMSARDPDSSPFEKAADSSQTMPKLNLPGQLGLG